MGKKSSVALDVQKQLFVKNQHQLKGPKYDRNLYQKLAAELNYAMSPKALYLSYKRNFLGTNDVTSQSTKIDGKLGKISVGTTPSNSSTESTPLFGSPERSKNIDRNGVIFKFPVDIHEWKKIQPIRSTFRRNDKKKACLRYKTYKTIPKYKWSCLLRQKLWKHFKLPCTISFKNYNINGNEIIFHGKCTQCNATVRIHDTEKTDKIVEFLCEIINFDNNFQHDSRKKIRCTPYLRRKLSNNLKENPATIVHKDLARRTMTFGDIEPPTLPSLGALRIIRHESNSQHWHHKNEIISLINLADTVEYSTIIQEILIKPTFHVHYWLEEQINYYSHYSKVVDRTTISLDATGSICKPNNLTKKLFLYVVLLTASKNFKSVPVAQMVSDSHTKETIADWLSKWAKNITSPAEVITDDSSALIAAVINCFTKFDTTKDYLEASFKALEGNFNSLPNLYMRIDTSHFIKSVRKISLENAPKKVNFLFVQCILYIKKAENINIIKNIIDNLLTVILTKHHTKDCTEAQYYLKSVLQTVNINEIHNNITEDDSLSCDDLYCIHDDFQVDDTTFSELNFAKWFEETVTRHKKEVEVTGHLNDFYYPPILTTIKRLMRKLPLWSNVMIPLYKSDDKNPSSSGSEDHFKTLKHLLLKSKITKHRVDVFLQKHIKYLKGELNIAASQFHIEPNTVKRTNRRTKNRTSKKQQKPKRQFVQDSIFSDQPTFVENWRGQADEAVDLKQHKDIKFIKNGNMVQNSSVVNTCGFDAIMFLIAFGFKSFSNFKMEIEPKDNKLRDYVNLMLNEKVDNVTVYEMRNYICREYFNRPLHVKKITDCECNVANLFEQMFANLFYSAQFTKACTKEECQYRVEIIRPFIPLNINVINMFGIFALEESLAIETTSQICINNCGGTVISSYKLKKIITFDLNGTDAMVLCNIPVTININNQIYEVVGAIEYVGNSMGTLGHYKCHTLSHDQWLCYDDLALKINNSTVDSIFVHTLTYVLASDL